MNNKKFLNQLKKALSILSSQERASIIQELTSHSKEDNDANLFEKFGSPQKLAEQYIGEEAIVINKKSRKKKWLIITAVIVVILFILWRSIASLMKDEFDYSDTAIRQEKLSQLVWKNYSINSGSIFAFDQSKVVVYSSDSDQLSISWADSTSKCNASESRFYLKWCLIA